MGLGEAILAVGAGERAASFAAALVEAEANGDPRGRVVAASIQPARA